MKRYLIAAFLFFACSGVYAQSLSFSDLLNLTSMADAQSRDMLASSKGFKATGNITLNGKTYAQYTRLTKGTPDKNESVLVGAAVKNATGVLSHELSLILHKLPIWITCWRKPKNQTSPSFSRGPISPVIFTVLTIRCSAPIFRLPLIKNQAMWMCSRSR